MQDEEDDDVYNNKGVELISDKSKPKEDEKKDKCPC